MVSNAHFEPQNAMNLQVIRNLENSRSSKGLWEIRKVGREGGKRGKESERGTKAVLFLSWESQI